jgi:RNA polymerase sigma-70 factor (ECF subfamily)
VPATADAKALPLPPHASAAADTALAFDEVYETNFEFVWRSARSLGVHPSALDDVTQDVFVVVHRRLAEFEGRASIRTWLARILVRVVSEHRRRFRRKESAHTPMVDELLDGGGPSPAESAARQQAAKLLAQILDEMDEDRRTVFVLAEIEQMPVPEISEALGVNLNTVYSRLRLARRDYEKAVERLRARDDWRQR